MWVRDVWIRQIHKTRAVKSYENSSLPTAGALTSVETILPAVFTELIKVRKAKAHEQTGIHITRLLSFN